jgi:hypothetical protein
MQAAVADLVLSAMVRLPPVLLQVVMAEEVMEAALELVILKVQVVRQTLAEVAAEEETLILPVVPAS